MKAINKAVKLAGSQKKLGEICGISQVAVSKIEKGLIKLSADKAIKIENAFNGKVTCEELRPDINWSVLRRKVNR